MASLKQHTTSKINNTSPAMSHRKKNSQHRTASVRDCSKTRLCCMPYRMPKGTNTPPSSMQAHNSYVEAFTSLLKKHAETVPLLQAYILQHSEPMKQFRIHCVQEWCKKIHMQKNIYYTEEAISQFSSTKLVFWHLVSFNVSTVSC